MLKKNKVFQRKQLTLAKFSLKRQIPRRGETINTDIPDNVQCPKMLNVLKNEG